MGNDFSSKTFSGKWVIDNETGDWVLINLSTGKEVGRKTFDQKWLEPREGAKR